MSLSERRPSTASQVTRKRMQGEAEAEVFRSKTVDQPNGISLIFNNMTGIGIIQTASTFQQSGWLPTILCFILYMIISSLCALFIVEAMQAIPGNRFFTGTVEFGTLINFYFGSTAHIFGQIGLYGALQTMAIASLIQSSQTMDHLFVDVFGKTCGVSLGTSYLTAARIDWICVEDHGSSLSPFGDQYMLLTGGYLAAAVIIVPQCIYPLEDIVWVQTSIIVFIEWIVVSGISGLHLEYVPVFGDASGYGGLVGAVMLNFANQCWIASSCGLGTYILIGLVPALAFPIPNGLNLIAVMQAGDATVSKVFGYMFSVTGSDDAYVIPWVLTIPFATGIYLMEINIWGALIFVSTANFIVPLVIYLKALLFRKAYNERRFLTKKQRELLKVIHGKGHLHHEPVVSLQPSPDLEPHRTGSFSFQPSPVIEGNVVPTFALQEPDQDIAIPVTIGLLVSSPVMEPTSMKMDYSPSMEPVQVSGFLSVPVHNPDRRGSGSPIPSPLPSSSPNIHLPAELLDLDLEVEAYLLDNVPDPDVEEEFTTEKSVYDDADGSWFRHMFGNEKHPYEDENDDYDDNSVRSSRFSRRNSWITEVGNNLNPLNLFVKPHTEKQQHSNQPYIYPKDGGQRSPASGKSPTRGHFKIPARLPSHNTLTPKVTVG
ncbi:hypothetical protein BDR26DRAFT_899262 [Obelidium mucronatum]|nr:hypothetical protein BDR26DRAFT_899262 [Obelidium mucronatum]